MRIFCEFPIVSVLEHSLRCMHVVVHSFGGMFGRVGGSPGPALWLATVSGWGGSCRERGGWGVGGSCRECRYLSYYCIYLCRLDNSKMSWCVYTWSQPMGVIMKDCWSIIVDLVLVLQRPRWWWCVGTRLLPRWCFGIYFTLESLEHYYVSLISECIDIVKSCMFTAVVIILEI